MSPIIIYLLKSITCSGLLFFYYRLALYNKVFHQWNRFYLVGAVLISLILPLVHISLPESSPPSTVQVIRLLDISGASNEFAHDDAAIPATGIDYGFVLSIVYIIVSAFILFFVLRGLVRLFILYKQNPKQRLDDIRLILTEERNAPFSFFRNIFWNIHIDLHSNTGEKILQHEITHAREMHSADRLLMNVVLVFFWCNPFYWLFKKEIGIVHEFIADSKTIKDHDVSLFSEMILSSAFPRQDFSTTSHFSSTSLKRRLLMLTKMQHPTVSYLGRLLIIPVVVLLFAAFTLRTGHPNSLLGAPTDEKITVMIDAGHGGDRVGISAADGTKEKDLTLAIAKKIQQLNTNGNIQILMSRDADNSTDVRARVDMAMKKKVDAFISIHINNAAPTASGFDFYISKNESKFTPQSQLLGSIISLELGKIYSVVPELKRGRENGGIWVLDAPEINYPSVLIECGNIQNSNDLAFVKSAANQQKIAEQILKAIEQYAKDKGDKTAMSDTNGPAKIKGIEVRIEEGSIILTLDDNKVINADPSKLMSVSSNSIFIDNLQQIKDSALVIVDGKVVPDISLFDMKKARILQRTDMIRVDNKTKLILISTNPDKPVLYLDEKSGG